MGGVALLLLLAVGLSGPADALVPRDERRQVTDVLTEKLFAVSDMLTTLQRLVERLDAANVDVASLDRRLQSLEERVVAMSGGEAELRTLRSDLLSRLDGVEAALARMDAARFHDDNRTHTACRDSVDQLRAPLAELKEQGQRTHEAAERAEQAVTDGVQLVDGQLAQMAPQLKAVAVGQAELLAHLTQTTPAPTEDPQAVFFNSLLSSIRSRTNRE